MHCIYRRLIVVLICNGKHSLLIKVVYVKMIALGTFRYFVSFLDCGILLGILDNFHIEVSPKLLALMIIVLLLLTNVGVVIASSVYSTISLKGEEEDPISNQSTTFSILIAIGIFFLLQGGLAIVYGKYTKQKNILKILLKNVLDTISGIVGMWSVGNAAGFFDNTSAFFVSSVPLASAATAITATTTAVAIKKRVKSSYAFLCYFMVIPFVCSVASGNDLTSIWSSDGFLTNYNFILTGFVYPVVVYSIWSSSGFLTAFGPGVGVASGPLTVNEDPIYSLWSSSEGLIAAPAPTFLEFRK